MIDIKEADELYEKRLHEDPEYNHKLVMRWREKMPESFAITMYEDEYGCHIFSEDLYEEATSYFVNPDGSKGPHWSITTIKEKSGIDFDTKDYTCYDYAYVVNMLYSDYSIVFVEPTYYLKMAKAYLTDEDYPGEDASERAYHDAVHRIEYFKHHA